MIASYIGNELLLTMCTVTLLVPPQYGLTGDEKVQLEIFASEYDTLVHEPVGQISSVLQSGFLKNRAVRAAQNSTSKVLLSSLLLPIFNSEQLCVVCPALVSR